jgi:hypothetical protein
MGMKIREFSVECHCGNVKSFSNELPESMTSCNCSICHRLGALWAYYDSEKVKVQVGDKSVDTYSWGEKTITYHRCGECGCTTHYTTVETNGNKIIAINCRMASSSITEKIPVRQFDGLLTWKYQDA